MNMIYKRYAHALIPIYDNIFAIGGYEQPDVLGTKALTHRTVEKFNLEFEEWVEVSSMNTPRAFFGACPCFDQFIYVFGGYHNFKMLDSIERYDQILDVWNEL